jgi:hypothetical protein
LIAAFFVSLRGITAQNHSVRPEIPHTVAFFGQSLISQEVGIQKYEKGQPPAKYTTTRMKTVSTTELNRCLRGPSPLLKA